MLGQSVEFQVAMIGGSSCSVHAAPLETLAELQNQIADALGVADALQLRFLNDEAVELYGTETAETLLAMGTLRAVRRVLLFTSVFKPATVQRDGRYIWDFTCVFGEGEEIIAIDCCGSKCKETVSSVILGKKVAIDVSTRSGQDLSLKVQFETNHASTLAAQEVLEPAFIYWRDAMTPPFQDETRAVLKQKF